MVVFLGSRRARAADWPTFRHDSLRSGCTAEPLPRNLSLRWTYRARHAPCPAWPARDTRMAFDHAYHAVISDGTLFFGSSADCKVYALDAATGAERWSFFTEGPVRFAPTVWKDRLFVAGDDGLLYGLRKSDGKMLWSLRAGPDGSRVLGNDRMVSRWPVRGAPVVFDDTLYFGAGIWPSEDIFLYAIDIPEHKVLWTNSSSGGLVMEQPHPGNRARSGISAQGYLAADEYRVFVPTGRGVPAMLSRGPGTLRYFHLMRNKSNGGSDILVAQDRFFNGGFAFDARTGARCEPLQKKPRGNPVVVSGGDIIRWEKHAIRAFRWAEAEITDPPGKKSRTLVQTEVWSLKPPYGGTSLITAGRILVSGGRGAGGYGVCTVELTTKSPLWSARTDGDPWGLAAADGRLYVSTDKGTITCYDAGPPGRATVIEPPANDAPYGSNAAYSQAAEEIVRLTGVTEGYCLDLGCGDGALAYALAKRTKLHIYGVEADPEKAALARSKLDSAGLYGVRVTVFGGDPAASGCPDYVANLIVSQRSLAEGPSVVSREEVNRLLRPHGGTACIGRPGEMERMVRGPLEGAGDWTHQYADAAATLCSTDRLVRAPLRVLWFADLGFPMPDRHGRPPAPLVKDGIMVVEGLHGLVAVDAYNGHRLWEFPLNDLLEPYDHEHLLGTAGTNGNMCIADDSVYLRTGSRCLRIALADGRKVREYAVPPDADGRTGPWGYIACVNGTLYGSRANETHVVRYLFLPSNMRHLLTESSALFALDVETGGRKWSYAAEESIRHNAIVIGGDRVYLIDRARDERDHLRFAEVKKGEPVRAVPGPGAKPGVLVCLDAATGKVVWKNTKDIDGTMLALSTKHKVLIMAHQRSQRSYHLPSEEGKGLTAFNASDGTHLWDGQGPYLSRPLINDRTVYTQPFARDLLTGERKAGFALNDRSDGSCGTTSGCPNLLLYRSGTLGYTDLLASYGTENYGGVRPGCWVNTIPASGLVLMPDATEGCTCGYLMETSVALQPCLRAPWIFPRCTYFLKSLTVRMTTDVKDADLRYTLDRSPPTLSSNQYVGPITLSQSATVKARAFRSSLAPSKVTAATFVRDANCIPPDDPAWSIHDPPDSRPPKSDWRAADGLITELSGFFSGEVVDPDPAKERPGTLRIYDPGREFTDGELKLDIASPERGGVGVAFRFQAPDRHYLWAMDNDRRFHVLARRNGTSYQVLASSQTGYQPDRWYTLRLVLTGPKITVYLDDQKDLEATDATFARGTFALYAWGCPGAKFRNLRWEARGRK